MLHLPTNSIVSHKKRVTDEYGVTSYQIVQSDISVHIQQLEGGSTEDLQNTFGADKTMFIDSFTNRIDIGDKIVQEVNGKTKEYDVKQIYKDIFIGTEVYEILIR